MTAPLLVTRDALAEVLRAHVLGGDTAQQYDQAGQCSCGQKFYEVGGGPTAYLLANRRLLDAHAAHISDALLASGVVRDPATLVPAASLADVWPDTFGEWTADQADAARAMKQALLTALAAALTEDR